MNLLDILWGHKAVLQPVKQEEVYDGQNSLLYPAVLRETIMKQMETETKAEYERRQEALAQLARNIEKRYDVRWSYSHQGGFSITNLSHHDLRFIVENHQIGAEQRPVRVGFYFSRCGPQSEEGKRLMHCGVDYINGLIELYQHKPWKEP